MSTTATTGRFVVVIKDHDDKRHESNPIDDMDVAIELAAEVDGWVEPCEVPPLY